MREVKLKTVACFTDPYLAHIVKGRLETEGVLAVVIDEHIVGMNWLYSVAVGGVKVQVEEGDFERSRSLLMQNFLKDLAATPESHLPSSPEEMCPMCQSFSVSGNRYSFWSLLPSLFFLAPIFFRRKKWICNDCDSKW